METTATEVQPTRREIRRKKLIALSQKARAIREENGTDEYLNDIIIEEFYSKDGHEEFHLMHEWNKRGYQVKKGSTAFVVWGKRRKVEVAPNDESPEGTSYKYFPLAYLFSNLQVEKK